MEKGSSRLEKLEYLIQFSRDMNISFSLFFLIWRYKIINI